MPTRGAWKHYYESQREHCNYNYYNPKVRSGATISNHGTGRVVVRHGHLKAICSPEDVQKVSDQFLASRLYRSNAGDQDDAQGIPAFALELQHCISKAFPGRQMSTLRVAINALRNVGTDHSLLKELNRLNDVASFYRHVHAGWENQLRDTVNAALEIARQRYTHPSAGEPGGAVAPHSLSALGSDCAYSTHSGNTGNSSRISNKAGSSGNTANDIAPDQPIHRIVLNIRNAADKFKNNSETC